MNNEKDFYDILRTKFNSAEQPFDEENWKTMRKMIDDSRSSRIRALWLLSSLGLLLFTAGVFVIYKLNSETGKPNLATVKPSTSQITVTTPQPILSKVNNSFISNTKTNSGLNENNIAGNSLKDNLPHSNQDLINTGKSSISSNTSISRRVTGNERNFELSATQNNPDLNGVNTHAALTSSNPENIAVGNSNGESKKVVSDANSSGISSVPNSSSTLKETTSTAKISIKKIDSSALLNENLPSRYSDEPFIMQGKTNIFSVEAGVSWTGGWDYGLTTQGHGFNPIVGIGYMHYLKSKLFLKTGLQFSDFGNMNSVPYIVQRKEGNIVNDSVLTTKRLYYLTIPLQLEYYLGKNTIGGNKNTIGAGGSISYLVGSSGSVTTYQVYDNNPPVNLTQYSHFSTLKGYATFSTSIYAFYKRTLSHKFALYGYIYYGLTDLKSNSFFGTNLFERDKGLKILVSYNL